MPAVGKLLSLYRDPAGACRDGAGYPLGYCVGTCSATVISNGFILTAGHCVYNPDRRQYPFAAGFIPGMTWADASNRDSIQQPWGVWRACDRCWWVPQSFRDELQLGLDFAVLKLEPQNGQWIGQKVGSWSALTNIGYGENSKLWITGYPSNGYWASAQGFHGRGQWACQVTIDGAYQVEQSGYALWAPCSMNQGASGGPWFVYLQDGRVVVGAVTSRCYDNTGNKCSPYAQHMLGTYLGSNFGEFWESIPG
jgi:hypothetical protein